MHKKLPLVSDKKLRTRIQKSQSEFRKPLVENIQKFREDMRQTLPSIRVQPSPTPEQQIMARSDFFMSQLKK